MTRSRSASSRSEEGPPSPHDTGIPDPGERTDAAGAPAPMKVIITATDGKRRELSFDRPFRIGRGGECDVIVESKKVSRVHVEMEIRDGRWWVRDLGSTNGTFLDGERVTLASVPARAVLQLGGGDPRLLLRCGDDAEEKNDATLVGSLPTETYYVKHYLADSKGTQVGQRTIMIRQAFRDVMRKRRRKYVIIIGAVALLFAGAVAVSLYQRAQLAKQRGIAEDIFYQMKAVELQLAQLEGKLGPSTDPGVRAELSADHSKLAGLQRNYDTFLTELGVYGPKMTPEHRLVMRIARVFGECELTMPEGFANEVDHYIKWWQGNTRLPDAISRAEAKGYATDVVQAMTSQHLPPQFFYLALEESDFQTNLCGPKTRYGIPKGAWQFIPETALLYGLHTGPLYLLPLPDPRDDRLNFAKATEAAAHYLHAMYSKDAQASGLLVVASYNWGEGNIRALIRSMPENPKDRNMWQLIKKHRKQIPRETYAYVFRVFSAAVIGENPKLFGFDFSDPLAMTPTASAKVASSAPSSP
jgi:membrane-bound lytic murein transglycosylase D